MTWPNDLSLGVFVAIVAIVVGCFVAGLTWAAAPERRLRTALLASLGSAAWLALTGGLVASGFFQVDVPFSRVGPYAITGFIMAFILAFSPIGRQLATGVPIAALVAFHGFRLPLELVLHAWADQGTIPVDLSYGGENFDIVIGVTALLLAPFARRLPWLVAVFDVVGLLMLANIVRIVLRTTVGSPLYADRGQPPLELAMHVPMTWIVTVCVMGAVAGHLVILRWLWMQWRTPERITAPRPRASG